MGGFRSAAVLTLCIGVCVGAGGLAGWATASSVATWYATLARPSWTPPDAVFGPVWTVLYVLMGVSAWRVLVRRGRRGIGVAMTLFAVQLLLNVAWSFLFFGLRSPGWAAVEIVALWGSIVATAWSFLRIDRAAAALLAPYLLWVTYAGALNMALWRMNP
jgi:tryptophan-rich sensory protein